jgi:hypothetical protein
VQITWRVDDRPVAEGDANIVLSDDRRRLHINKARITDAGIYKCIARNPAGESTKTFDVEVLGRRECSQIHPSPQFSSTKPGRIEVETTH